MFSPTEEKVIKAITKRHVSVLEVANRVYKNSEKPLNPRNTVAGIIQRVNRKCLYYKLDWHIAGEGLGRHGKTVWKESLKEQK